ncbi:hypothetical protein PUN28_000427 [Cardiocondyla obscurior]|uniref:Crossover junction endonuclease MUS81 n=3 Tax=Cardiocondyla obscurior TaxID=286306 RepID=A0AAW2GZG8_9HYME
MKRIKIVPDRPNHLFESWLKEWRDQAALRNSELHSHFTKALESLRRYPLPLESGKECIILQHFGTKLCTMLDKKLEEYKKQKSIKAIDNCISDACSNNDYTSISREKTVEECQVFEIQDKEAVVKQAMNTKKNTNKLANANKIISQEIDRYISLEPNTFDIVLLVDTQETCGKKTKPQHDATLAELTQLGVLFEVRRLKVGDFAWIARCHKTNNELVLPYIIERKRMDDLSASIIDGRFHEQKFRLKQSGIENLMYIVENIDKNLQFAVPLSSLLQASVNSLVQDGFTIKYTKNHKESMLHLSCITKILIKTYKNKKLVGCKKEQLTQTSNVGSTLHLMEFKEFNKSSSKQRTFKVSEMFIRQLLQLKGMSVDKALAIVERYASPQILITALENSINGEQLLANIQVGDKKRRLGPTIIYMFVGISVYMLSTFIPQVLDVFLPLNESRSREHPFHAEFFLDDEKDFYTIRFIMYFGILFVLGVILANGTIFVVYMQHVTGMFTILGYRAELSFNDKKLLPMNQFVREKHYGSVALFVQDHRSILQFVDIIQSCYGLNLFLEFLSLMILIGLTLVQVIKFSGTSDRSIRSAAYITGQLTYMFMYSYMGQQLIDKSTQLSMKIYNARWYRIPISKQRMMLYIMLKCVNTITINAYNIYVLSLESFSAVSKKLIIN